MNKFKEIDDFLLKDSKIIHQIWFNTIPTPKDATEVFKTFRKYCESWISMNPNIRYHLWNLEDCNNLIKYIYPEYEKLIKRYEYQIQFCDVIRYFILKRYGGLYVDCDYQCIKSFEDIFNSKGKYNKDFYLVETPNKMQCEVFVSNSLMFSKNKNHFFWNQLIQDLEKSLDTIPSIYNRHLKIMYTTGPGIVNKIFQQNNDSHKANNKLDFLPYKEFHPLEIGDIKTSLMIDKCVYAIHYGRGTWEKKDSRILIHLYPHKSFLFFISIIFFSMLGVSIFTNSSEKHVEKEETI